MGSLKQRATKAYEAYDALKKLRYEKGQIDFSLAALLSFLKKDRNYKLITGDVDSTWAQFLADPELPVRSMSTADRLISIYNKYILEFEISPKDLYGLDTNCLQRASTIVNKRNVRHWLAQIEHLSRKDFYRLMMFGDKNETKCRHEYVKRYTLSQCAKCGAEQREIHNKRGRL